ncbi:hypothetical protein TWF696_009687 [Orbilia brochopaga]|uniref:Cytochrome b561 domain-containing protein n=1 Tax=Orbilia brochopaga TaxID=3140254 RepID=A0AAV9UCX2_9PEZI
MAQKAVLLLFCALVLAAPEPSPDYGDVIREDDRPLEDGLQTRLPAGRRQLILIHSGFAAVAWLFLAPAAVIIARFFKSAGIGRHRRWFRLHFVLQMGTVAFMVVAFLTGYYAVTPGSKYQFKNPHFQIGTAAFAAVLAQTLLGIINHFVLRPRRQRLDMPPQAQYPFRTPFTNRMHILLGWFLLGLGVANIPIGMVLKGTKKVDLILFGVYVGLVLLAIFVLEAVRGRDRDNLKADERERSIASASVSSASSESVLPVAGGRITEEVLYFTSMDDLYADLQRVQTAPEVPATVGTGGHGREHGRERPVRSRSEVAPDQRSEQPTLKETSTGQPIIEKVTAEHPTGEVAEQVDGTEQQQESGRMGPKSVVRV